MTEAAEVIESKNERIGFWTRLAAYLIDIVFTFLFGFVLTLFVGDLFLELFFGNQVADFENQMIEIQEVSSGSSDFITPFIDIFRSWMSISAGATIGGFILIVLEGAFGQSVGKFILRIKNTNVDGTVALPQTLWMRSFLKYGSSIFSLIGSMTGLIGINLIGSFLGLVIFVGFFLVFMDNKQTIHDMLAKTVVSRK